MKEMNSRIRGSAFALAIAAFGMFSCKPGEFNVLSLTPVPQGPSTHGGWTAIKAVGAVNPVSQSGLSATSATVTLSWNASTIKNGSIQSYRVFRGVMPGTSQNSGIYAGDLSASVRTFTDSSVASGQTYYYSVSPVVDGQTLHASQTADYEAKVIVPPENMSLLHRWIANQEMCGLMGRSPDRSQNYRCAYSGPGNVSGYFDIQKSRLVDTVELGCNYTPAPSCGSVANGCLGTAAPGAGVGSNGDVFYDRTAGTCYVKVAGAWSSAGSALSSANRALLASSKPGLPPLVTIGQSEGWSTCIAKSETGFGAKRLLTHQEQLLASAWLSSLSDSEIDAIEGGASGGTNGRCNTAGATGLTYDNLTTPADLETLPGTLAGVRSVRTGSTYSTGCKSAYGVQDLIGNVWEWSSDQLGACSAVTHSCVGAASSLDASNTLWSGFDFDGTIGPGGGGIGLTDWGFSAMSYSATQILLPLGLPVVASAASSWDATPIGTGTGQFDPSRFHSDRIYLYTDNGGASRGLLAGGSQYDGAVSGRYTVGIDALPTDVYNYVGLRCGMDAE